MAFNNPLAGENLVKNATTSVFTIKGASPTDTGALFYTVPAPLRYIDERVHILAYDSAERTAWGAKGAKRRNNMDYNNNPPTADQYDIHTALATGYSGNPARFLSKTAHTTYTSETTYQYNHSSYNDYRYEMYHPDVFSNAPPSQLSRGYPTSYTTVPYAYRFLGPDLGMKQTFFDSNNSVHNLRLEIAAKASLMLYRTPKITDYTVDDVEPDVLEETKRQRDAALTRLESDTYGLPESYYAYRDLRNQVADLVAPGLKLNRNTFNAIVGLSNSADDLPASFDSTHRNASGYGLWGKWYSPGNGFHRGIDIAHGSGSIIYSICAGTVKYVNNTASRLVIEVTPRIGTANQFLTYMHADFNSFSVDDELLLGDRIGTESDRGATGNPHTHIELNNAYYADFNFTQAKHPSDSISSLAPYAFLAACFRDFYDSIIEAND